MISPKGRSNNIGGFHRRLLTLGQILDVTPQNAIQTEVSPKNFETFHSVFRCKTKLFQKTPTHKLSKPQSTSTSPIASPGRLTSNRDLLPGVDSSSVTPLLDSRAFHARQNTMDSQLLRQIKTRQSPFILPREKNTWTLASPKASPRVSFTSINSPVASMKSNESLLGKKDCVSEKKLPNKRRGLRKSIRAIYSDIVNTPILKNLQDWNSKLPGTEIEDTEISNPLPRSKYLSKEEKQIANEIENEGKRDFQETLNIYNRFHKNHLFEPEGGPEDQNILVRSVIPERFKPQYISSPYVRISGSPQKNHQSALLHVSPVHLDENSSFKSPSVGPKFLQGVDKSHLKQRRVKPLLKKKEGEEEESLQMINDSANLKRMKEMSDSLKTETPLTEEEKEFFRLVKQNGKKLEIIFKLSNKKELVHIRDNRKETPMHWAVKRENYELMEILYQNGADLHALDIVSRKPLDIARRIQNPRIIRFLEDKMNLVTNQSPKDF